MEESLFAELSAPYEDKTTFKSPRGICRLGFPQIFKVIEEDEEAASGAQSRGVDPVEILKEEHKGVLKRLELIEEQISKRDIDGLWVTTAMILNDITLHSIEKEEGVLFPLLAKAFPMSEAQITIIMEDHRELVALLSSFRRELKFGDILDGVANSVIANLRSHISKENEEFFEVVDKYLDDEGKMRLLEGMKKADESHVVVEAGDRCSEIEDEEDAASMERERYKEALSAVEDLTKESGCGH